MKTNLRLGLLKLEYYKIKFRFIYWLYDKVMGENGKRLKDEQLKRTSK